MDKGAWLHSMGSQRVRHDSVINTFTVLITLFFYKGMLVLGVWGQ